MKPALDRGVRKFIRTLAQVAAGGALTALVTAVGGHMAPATSGLVLGAWTAIVAFLQNYLETAGRIPALLPTPATVVVPGGGAVIGQVVGTLEPVVTAAGDVVGEVIETGGDMVEKVSGDHEDGSIPMAVLIAVGIIVLLFIGIGVCGDAIFEDEDEENDLGWVPVAELMDRDEDNDPRHDCYRAEASCEDNDFSPSFDKSPVEDSFQITVCLPGSTCNGAAPEEEAA
ncbi:MAG: hypothetical protein LC798_19105 [Chloroflexi bacterium]|nr:hypothetical protein [Chloroflexota bacterium]